MLALRGTECEVATLNGLLVQADLLDHLVIDVLAERLAHQLLLLYLPLRLARR